MPAKLLIVALVLVIVAATAGSGLVTTAIISVTWEALSSCR